MEPDKTPRIITHDGYLKVAQLSKLDISFSHVAIGGAQDMTPCQADLFWGSHQRKDKVIYLFGDQSQQIYRFRGVGDDFRTMSKHASDGTQETKMQRFRLTGSFRFGENVAKFASCIVESMGSEALQGLALEEGRVSQSSDFLYGVVICRGKNGMSQFLLQQKPERWCFLDDDAFCTYFQIPGWVWDLEAFVWSLNDDVFMYRGETFNTLDDILRYIDDVEDIALLRQVSFLLMLKDSNTKLDDFSNEIRLSYAPMKEGETVDTYQGAILTSVHQAKGMEFDKVLVWDDFPFGIVRDVSFLCMRRIEDEANLVYVAMTRCKVNLYLSDTTFDYLKELRQARENRFCFGDDTDGISAFEAQCKSFESLRQEWDVKWNAFEQDTPPESENHVTLGHRFAIRSFRTFLGPICCMKPIPFFWTRKWRKRNKSRFCEK